METMMDSTNVVAHNVQSSQQTEIAMNKNMERLYNIVFGCRDLKNHIISFVNPYWVNPFFSSIEGALLENRQELLGEEGYEFQTNEQLVQFVRYYANNYPKYALEADFSSILNYAFSAVLEGNEYRSMQNIVTRLLSRILRSNDEARLREFIHGIYPSNLIYSFAILYEECEVENESSPVSMDMLVLGAECELEEISRQLEEGNVEHPLTTIEYFDRQLQEAITDMFDMSFPTRHIDALYRLRLENRFIRQALPQEDSFDLCKVLVYARLGHIDSFGRYRDVSYLKNCIECMEQLVWSEKLILSESPYMSRFYGELIDSYEMIHYVTVEAGERDDDLLVSRLNTILEHFWTM